MREVIVGGKPVAPGFDGLVHVPVARLPTGTLIDLTAHVFRAQEDGPTLVVQGGLHGDELNGIEICRRIIADRASVPQRGTLIVVPVLNTYGFLHFSRDVPDGKDVNRSFPGTRKGSLASRVAYTYVKHVFKSADYAIDLHTGGGLRHNHPQVRYTPSDPGSLVLAEAFGAPFVLPAKVISKSFRATAVKQGVPAIVFEGGETQRIDDDVVEEGVVGVRRVIHHLGMVDEGPLQGHSQLLTHNSWLRAPNSGLWRNAVLPGERVAKGHILGWVTDPYATDSSPLVATHDSWIVSLNHQAVVTGGDALVRLGWHDPEEG